MNSIKYNPASLKNATPWHPAAINRTCLGEAQNLVVDEVYIQDLGGAG